MGKLSPDRGCNLPKATEQVRVEVVGLVLVLSLSSSGTNENCLQRHLRWGQPRGQGTSRLKIAELHCPCALGSAACWPGREWAAVRLSWKAVEVKVGRAGSRQSGWLCL